MSQWTDARSSETTPSLQSGAGRAWPPGAWRSSDGSHSWRRIWRRDRRAIRVRIARSLRHQSGHGNAAAPAL